MSTHVFYITTCRLLVVALLMAAGTRSLTVAAQSGDDKEPVGPIIELPGHTGAVGCIAVSPDGRFAVTHGGLGDHAAHFWDLTRRREVSKMGHAECTPAAVVWTPDGKLIVNGGDGGRGSGAVLLQDILTGKRVGQVIPHDSVVHSVALTKDGKRIAAGDWAGLARIYDFKTGVKLREFKHGASVNSVVFSGDGQYLLTGCQDKMVRLWSIDKDRQERRLEGHKGPVGRVAFSADGKQAFSASFWGGDTDNTIRFWNTESGKETDKLQVGGEGHLLMATAFSADGRRALTGHHNGDVRLWDLTTKKKLAQFSKHKYPVSSVAFTPDGRFALSGEDCQGGSAMWLYRLPRP
jgi:WD40 repeat protein